MARRHHSKSRKSRRSRRSRRSHRSRKSSRSRKSHGGASLVGALKTALLPFLLFKSQKHQQKRIARKKTLKRRKTKRRR